LASFLGQRNRQFHIRSYFSAGETAISFSCIIYIVTKYLFIN
jgi:hypothetical protein